MPTKPTPEFTLASGWSYPNRTGLMQGGGRALRFLGSLRATVKDQAGAFLPG